jgi:uncharacterized protein (TIGR03435 family)
VNVYSHHERSPRGRFLLLAAAFLAVMSPRAPCQQAKPQLTPLKFDVVSVKPNKSDQFAHIDDTGDGDGITFRNMPLNWIILYAYDLRDMSLLSGFPDWVKSNKYDIQAKVGESDLMAFHKLTKDQRRLMLQDILADRFKMKVHGERKETSVYALVVAKNGPQLKKVEPGEKRVTGIENKDGTIVQGQLLYSRRPGQIIGQEVPMELFAKSLSGLAGRPVIDNTGITGVYDFKLEWQPDHSPPGGEPGEIATDPSAPSLFSAVQEQLGLKLESQKVAIPIIVIDHIEDPSEN